MSSENSPGSCLVCGKPKCKLVSHRLAQLEVQRRVLKARERDQAVAAAVRHAQRSLDHAAETPPSMRVTTPPNEIDPFVSFPIKGLRKSSMRQFQEFFTNQSFSVFDSNHPLGFDVAVLPKLLSQAMQDAALCMSFVAMASTYNAIHRRNLRTPDKELLVVYNQCFQTLRKAVAKSKSETVPESVIMAAVNLVICCGIGFGDRQNAITHWNGVLALINKQNPYMHSGTLISFIQQLEYWLTLMAGLNPRNEQWLEPVASHRALPQVYGQAFQPLFEKLTIGEDLAPKMLETCTSTCRAVEMLESFAKNPRPMPDTYFIYFRGILADQNAKVYSTVRGSNTLAECLNITLNIFLVTVLQVTPWRAPLEHLCSMFRQSFIRSRLGFTWDMSMTILPSGEADLQDLDTRDLLCDMSVWMLCICIRASQLTKDENCEEWATALLHDACQVDEEDEEWQVDVLRQVRRFCWSDEFLSKHVFALSAPLAKSELVHGMRTLSVSS